MSCDTTGMDRIEMVAAGTACSRYDVRYANRWMIEGLHDAGAGDDVAALFRLGLNPVTLLPLPKEIAVYDARGLTPGTALGCCCRCFWECMQRLGEPTAATDGVGVGGRAPDGIGRIESPAAHRYYNSIGAMIAGLWLARGRSEQEVVATVLVKGKSVVALGGGVFIVR